MNRDDWLAAILITAIIAIGIIVGLYLAGFWDPNGINTTFQFIQNKTALVAVAHQVFKVKKVET